MFPALPGATTPPFGSTQIPGITPGGSFGGDSTQLALILGTLGLGTLAGGLGTPMNSSTQSNSTSNSDISTQQDSNTKLDTLLNLLNNYSQDTTGTTTSTGTTVQGTMPTLSPATQAFMDQLISKYGGMTAPALTGYGAQQTGVINNQANVQKQALDNILAARGLSTSPAAATAQAGIEQNRLNNITSMQQGLPLLQNQLNLQNLAGASAFFSAIPKGTLTTGASNQTTQTNQSTTGQSSGTQTGSQTGSTSTTGSQKGTTTNTGSSTTQGTSGGGAGGAAGAAGAGLATVLPYLLQIFGPKNPNTPGSTIPPYSMPPVVPGDEDSGPPAIKPPQQLKVL